MPPNAYEVFKELEREQQFAPQEGSTQTSYSTWRERAMNRNLRRGLAIIGSCWILYFVYFIYLHHLYDAPSLGYADNADQTTAGNHVTETSGLLNKVGKRVPLDVHVMSKCPDARDCLQHLIVPAMERISDKVDFKLSFIGSVSDSTSDVECKHGPTECIGNMLCLCAANLPFPSAQSESASASDTTRTPVVRSLGFANCLISDYPDIPSRSLVESCVLEFGLDFEALNTCASHEDDDFEDPHGSTPDDPSGIALLRKSVRHSQEVGVTKSCTIRLDETVWCIRDDGQWKNCAHGSDVSTFVEEVERLWLERN